MAFKEVVGLDCDKTTALGGMNKKTGKPNPKKAEGYFLGSREVDSKLSKTGKALIHVLQTSEGTLGIWGKTDLDRKIGNVPTGTMVRITQNGTAPSGKGNPMYKFLVEIDEENTIDVGPVAESSVDAGSAEPAYEDADCFSEDSVDADDAAADELPPQRAKPPARPAAPPSADRQAAVRDMLNRRKAV